MSKNYLKKLIIIIALVFAIFGISDSAKAQLKDYNVLAPLPGTTKTTCNNGTPGPCTDFTTYLPNMFYLIIGVAAGLAFVMITIGGITYATSDALQTKEDGKRYVTNAVYGLLLVLASYIILFTINPEILKLDLVISSPQLQSTGNPSVSAVGGNCTGCTTFSSTIPLKPGIGTNTSPAMNSRLVELAGRQSNSGISWWVSEGYPPSATHNSPCHYNGLCLDANFKQGVVPTAQDIYTFAKNARSSGLVPVYEVKTQQEYDALYKADNRLGTYLDLNTSATAAHFHLRLQ
jgi:hypothetical protein